MTHIIVDKDLIYKDVLSYLKLSAIPVSCCSPRQLYEMLNSNRQE